LSEDFPGGGKQLVIPWDRGGFMTPIGPPHVNTIQRWDGTIEPAMKKIVVPFAARRQNAITASQAHVGPHSAISESAAFSPYAENCTHLRWMFFTFQENLIHLC